MFFFNFKNLMISTGLFSSLNLEEFFDFKTRKTKDYGQFKQKPSIQYNGQSDLLKEKFSRFHLQILLQEHLVYYPTPVHFNYMWSFGSLAGIFFLLQLITGSLLAMHYTPHVDFAFSSVEHIMRDLNFGWLFRYIHANGASFFFIVVYGHIIKALYYNSFIFPYTHLWRIGILIFLLMMAIAFMGYVLPWGQMSFWGATVITNLFTAIPLVGEGIAFWIWGGFSVENATLNRFFSLHYLLPFFLAALIFLHLSLLHIPGSSNPLKMVDYSDKISFFPYFYLKDLFSIFFFFFYLVFLFFFFRII
jgi:quinol-cytochrome oxidoreductase complex cytochrome b subunit